MQLSRTEQETIISFNEEEQTANVYTFNGSLKRKLAGLAEERPEECRLKLRKDYGLEEYTIPKKWVRVTPPRVISEEERQRLAENSAKYGFRKRDSV